MRKNIQIIDDVEFTERVSICDKRNYGKLKKDRYILRNQIEFG